MWSEIAQIFLLLYIKNTKTTAKWFTFVAIMLK